MKLHNNSAEIYIPDDVECGKAISRTTHMTIAAHQDDIEIMAYEGIAECFGKKEKWHLGVVVTNGAGSPRSSIYKEYSDEEMQQIRKSEQKKAAVLGEYGAQVLLDYPSSQVKDKDDNFVIADLKELILKAKPKVIYTHNLADKHDTHIGVVVKVIKTLREIADEYVPEKLLGCEVWRSLDWVCDDEKVAMKADEREYIASALIGVFDSQICGGKRYDLAAIGRRRANATFSSSHQVDNASLVSYAMDLTPLIVNKDLDIGEYIKGYIQRFMDDVSDKIAKMD